MKVLFTKQSKFKCKGFGRVISEIHGEKKFKILFDEKKCFTKNQLYSERFYSDL